MSNRQDNKQNNSEPLKIWIWSLITVFFFGLFSYGYCVRGTIVNIVARQNMDSQISVLHSKVSVLEAQYLKAKNNITPELAQNLGFVAVIDQKFVISEVKVPSLSLVNTSN
jgi:hypothetical protein